jgi:Protein of unknown function (DUF982)
MHTKQFTQPVSILVGLGFHRRIKSVEEAFQVLNEWVGTLSPTYTMAINMCRAASSGEVDTETARLAFEAFARARYILVDERAMAA